MLGSIVLGLLTRTRTATHDNLGDSASQHGLLSSQGEQTALPRDDSTWTFKGITNAVEELREHIDMSRQAKTDVRHCYVQMLDRLMSALS